MSTNYPPPEQERIAIDKEFPNISNELLGQLIDPKSLDKLEKLGGINGLISLLKTNSERGLELENEGKGGNFIEIFILFIIFINN